MFSNFTNREKYLTQNMKQELKYIDLNQVTTMTARLGLDMWNFPNSEKPFNDHAYNRNGHGGSQDIETGEK